MDEKFQEMISDIKEIQPFFYGNIAEMFIAKGYRKESDTAREICLKIIKAQPQPIKEKWVEWFKKEYGVDLGE